MGAGSSSISELKENEYLLKFVSKQSISPNDPFWNRFLSFSFSPPRSSADSRLLEENCVTLFEALLSNNQISGNVAALTKVFLTRCSELKESANCQNNVFAWQTYNALFILRSVLKFFVENITEENLIKQINVKLKDVNDAEDGSLLERFLNAIIELIINVPVIDFTYVIHLEAINCLLVLLSEQMYLHKPTTNSVIFQAVMQGVCSVHASSLMKILLEHYIQQEKCPPGLSAHSGGGSIVLGLASSLWSALTLGYGSQQPTEDESNHNDALLAKQSSLLILVLANHCTSDKGIHNPYRQSLFTFTNSSDASSVTSATQVVATFKLDYALLYATVCQTLRDDETTLLLYLLLHRNLNFRSFLISRADIELLILPILKVLYHAEDKNSHHIYMSLIVLLILSEDEIFNKSIHDVNLKNITWYTERSISEISLGGLLILVVIRTIQFNMTRMRDKYLHTNCLAALANMSSQFRMLHAYVTQRIVSLFENLSKKHTRIVEQIKNSGNLSAKEEDEDEPLANAMQDLSVLEEVLRMVLEIINSCLSSQLSLNPNLVYTLLYKRHIFESFRMHPTFQDIVLNIDTVLAYFTARLEASDVELSVTEVLGIIKQGAHQWSHDRLKKFPELKFKYVEEEQPEEFFIPYVWSLVCRSSNLYWNSHHIRLFNAQS